MEYLGYVTTVLAVIGSALGVVNFVRSIRDDQVRLKVIPVLAWRHKDMVLQAKGHSNARLDEIVSERGHPEVAIEVVNLSKFPVTVIEVGLCEGSKGMNIRRAPLWRPTDIRGKACPIRLEAREAVTLHGQSDHAEAYDFTSATCAYVMTSCDSIRIGHSKALTWWSARHNRTSTPTKPTK